MSARLQSEAGMSLIETTVAVMLLLVALVGLMSMAGMATQYTENHGHLEARTAEYAQDKMEQLLALAYGDVVSDTVQFPAAAGGGTGMAVGGSIDTAAPALGYVDWLGYDGSLLGGGTAAPNGWFYQRVWQVSCVVAPCVDNPPSGPPTGVKQVSVVTTVKTSVGRALIPKSTVAALKAAEF
jgi:hypothetical protein